MSNEELKNYLQSHYGTCAFAVEEGACACLKGSRHADMLLCPDWSPVTESNWAEMYQRAESWYQSK